MQPLNNHNTPLAENRADEPGILTPDEFRRLSRRQLLAVVPALSLGLLTIPFLRERVLTSGLALADRASESIYSAVRLAPTFAHEQLTMLEQFPLNSIGAHEPEIDFDAWELFVEGEVARPGRYPLSAIQALPKYAQNVRHICIEGWSVVGSFGGARFDDFLTFVGANKNARFVEVACYDDYYTSYDIASCRHPQSLLCYEMYGQPLTRSHGAPLRVHMPTKLGYKSAKYLFSIRVSNELSKQRGFWEDQGYSWHGGI
jgi:DMSO/TMAO reductase YedYZ molybdopterin-dependent catalytic subunit